MNQLFLTRIFGGIALATCLLSSCHDGSHRESEGAQDSSDRPLVHASSYPLYYFAQRIGGDLIDLRFDTPAGIDPAIWQPSDDTVASMQQADQILMNGAEYETWLTQVSLPTNTRVDTSRAYSSRLISITGGVTHSHGDGIVHSHDGLAATTWLDMDLAKRQAEAVRDALIKLLPDAEAHLKTAAEPLLTEIDELDHQMIEAATLIAGIPLLTSHPLYQYLAKAYGLDIETVHWEPSIVPDAEGIAELDTILPEHPAQWMLWEATPDPQTEALLKAKGIVSIVFDPCGNRPENGDWMSVMQQNITALRALK